MPFYSDGKTKIKVKDKVLWGGTPGIIVFIFDDEQFSPEYPKEDWDSVMAENKGKGVGVLLKNGKLIIEKSCDGDDNIIGILEPA